MCASPDSPVASQEASYLQDLNPPQREAVLHVEGPLLVLAGAGTGKTRVLTARIAHLLRTGSASGPGEILAVTFTNKAAAEMRRRVAHFLDRSSVDGWFLGTFHAIGLRLLRRHADAEGLRSNFSILDPGDQLRVLKQVLVSARSSPGHIEPKQVLGAISRWKDRALLPDDVVPTSVQEERLCKIYTSYQEQLQTLNACDFGDLLLRSLHLLRTRDDILQMYHQRIRYILVDEYQDSNTVQYLWLRLLAQKRRNLFVVGDDDQSIYGWRGSEIGNILRFERDFPGAKVVRLEQNYRSLGHILRTASVLIGHNRTRLGKELWTSASRGEKVQVRGLEDGDTEALWIAEEIVGLQRSDKCKFSECAVLVRTSAQTRAFEEVFLKLGIPHKIVGAQRFYDRLETRDCLAYLRAVAVREDDLSFVRILNRPRRGLGATTLARLREVAHTEHVCLSRAAALAVDQGALRSPARKILSGFLDDIHRWRKSVDTVSPRLFAEMVFAESGYLRMWENDKSIEAEGRLENIQELLAALSEFSRLEDFLEHIALWGSVEDKQAEDVVLLMTLHAAKGLEFAHVYLPGWEDGLFPHQRAIEDSAGQGLEEERRLAYVGITRARACATICFVGSRNLHGLRTSSLPSRFLEELPRDSVCFSSDSGLWRHTPEQGFHNLRATRSVHLKDKSAYRCTNSVRNHLRIGEQVRHKVFGRGEVLFAEGAKTTVFFPKYGKKRIFATFLEKQS